MDRLLSNFERLMDKVQISLQGMINRIDTTLIRLGKDQRKMVSTSPLESTIEEAIQPIFESEVLAINKSPTQVLIPAVKATCDVEIIDSDEKISEGEAAIAQEQVPFSIVSMDLSISPNRNQIPGDSSIHKFFLKSATSSLHKGVRSVFGFSASTVIHQLGAFDIRDKSYEALYKNPQMLRVLEVNHCSGVRPFRWGNHECWLPPQCKYTETAVYMKDLPSILPNWVSVEFLYSLPSQATIGFIKGINIMNEHLDLTHKAVDWLYFTVMELLFGECSYLTCFQRECTDADVFSSGYVYNDAQFQISRASCTPGQIV